MLPSVLPPILRRLSLVAVAAVLVLSGCAGEEGTPQADEPVDDEGVVDVPDDEVDHAADPVLSVVATLSPIADLVGQVGGDSNPQASTAFFTFGNR